VNEVPGPKSLLARFDKPDAEPASTRYVVGDPVAAAHDRKTDDPFTRAVSAAGAPGGVIQLLDPTMTTISFDAWPTAPAFWALTRT
jgi:hypothetical protein